MRLGLVVYGSLDTVSGGFLYDRQLVRHLRSRGDEVEVISIPWRPYARGLLDNLSPALFKRLSRAAFELLLEDELAHPSLFRLNLASAPPGLLSRWWPSSITCVAPKPGPPGKIFCTGRWSANI